MFFYGVSVSVGVNEAVDSMEAVCVGMSLLVDEGVSVWVGVAVGGVV